MSLTRRSLVAAVMFAAAPIVSNGTLQAQTTCTVMAPNTSCSVDVTISMPTVRVVVLELTSTTIQFPTFGFDEMDRGYVASPGPATLIKANTAWNLMVSTVSSSTWQASGSGARADKPATDFQWSTSTDGPYKDLSTTAALAAQGGATSSSFTPFSYRTKVGWQADAPGQYALTVMYTIVAP